MAAYYNDHDPNAAEWLRQLIKLGAIAPGDVDERSIVDVPSTELRSYKQHHFFAGVGTWSYALRQAGWPDGRPVVTGSCPCQPYSQAGKRKGADDERDLWWAMLWHIQQLSPPTIFGEQVASKDGLTWWDTVSSDLESADYSSTAFDLCAAGISSQFKIPIDFTHEFTDEWIRGDIETGGQAPHARQRLFWVANANSPRWQWPRSPQSKGRFGDSLAIGAGETGNLADSSRKRLERWEIKPRNRRKKFKTAERTGDNSIEQAGFWDDAIWIPCADGKLRPAKSGTFPLVDGIASDLVRSGNSCIQTEETSEARAMRIKGYGNGIVAPLAIAFIECCMEALDDEH
ncbi:MAG: DNA cytosine methyltransferase [Cyanobacteria bacterium P01_F01_bin.3]